VGSEDKLEGFVFIVRVAVADRAIFAFFMCFFYVLPVLLVVLLRRLL